MFNLPPLQFFVQPFLIEQASKPFLRKHVLPFSIISPVSPFFSTQDLVSPPSRSYHRSLLYRNRFSFMSPFGYEFPLPPPEKVFPPSGSYWAPFARRKPLLDFVSGFWIASSFLAVLQALGFGRPMFKRQAGQKIPRWSNLFLLVGYTFSSFPRCVVKLYCPSIVTLFLGWVFSPPPLPSPSSPLLRMVALFDPLRLGGMSLPWGKNL